MLLCVHGLCKSHLVAGLRHCPYPIRVWGGKGRTSLPPPSQTLQPWVPEATKGARPGLMLTRDMPLPLLTGSASVEGPRGQRMGVWGSRNLVMGAGPDLDPTDPIASGPPMAHDPSSSPLPVPLPLDPSAGAGEADSLQVDLRQESQDGNRGTAIHPVRQASRHWGLSLGAARDRGLPAYALKVEFPPANLTPVGRGMEGKPSKMGEN